MQAQASIIIPVFNQWSFTAACLRSLKQHSPEDIQVIVIDNASTDQTAEELDTLGSSLWGDRFVSVHAETNLGFAKACNIGVKLSNSDFLLFLNNDTELTPNWLPPLLSPFATQKNLAATGPCLLYPGTNLIQHLGIAFLPGRQAEHLYEYFSGKHPLALSSRSPKAMTAAALCLPRSIFLNAGGFHEGYVNGCEDIDLCLNLGLLGYALAYVPESVVYHYTSQTPGRFDHDRPNSALLLSRHEHNLNPDIHHHALHDGFSICLNEWLLVSVSLSKERELELNSMAKGATPSQCFEILEKEPLWEQGYLLLADWLEERSAFHDSLHLRTLAAQFHPSRLNYIKLIKTAQKAAVPEVARHAQDKLEKVAEQSLSLRKKAVQKIQWAKAVNEPFWDLLYSDWLKNSSMNKNWCGTVRRCA